MEPTSVKVLSEASAMRSPAQLPSISLVLLVASLAACGDSHSQEVAHVEALGWRPEPEAETGIRVPPPPLSDETFPCSDCHDPEIPVNTRRREMKMAHTEIEFRHADSDRWCLDCHAVEDRDQLHLVNGTLISFEESYLLCGQCHGDKLRDWRVGVHGRREGSWDGEKSYLLCVHCHDSHDPAFKPIEPKPAPIPPTRTP